MKTVLRVLTVLFTGAVTLLGVTTPASADTTLPDQTDPVGVSIPLRYIGDNGTGAAQCASPATGLPPGLSQAGMQFYFRVKGTPYAPGAYTVTVTTGCDASQQNKTTATFIWTILPSPSPQKVMATGDQHDKAGTAVTWRQVGRSVCGPIKFAGLPPGVSATAEPDSTGGVLGTPTTPGTYQVRMTVDCDEPGSINEAGFAWVVD